MNLPRSHESFIIVLHVLFAVLDLILAAPTRLQKETRSGSKYIDMLRNRRSTEMVDSNMVESSLIQDTLLSSVDDGELKLVLNKDVAFSDEFLNEVPHEFTKRSAAENQNIADTPLKRSKRHSQNADSSAFAASEHHGVRDLTSSRHHDVRDVASSNHNRRSRQRRSIAWMLSATIEICNTHRHLCKTVELEEDEVRMTLNFQDA